jgi:beta-galactosidase
VGWYRKHFVAAEADRGRRFAIELDAVYKNCDVWINGHHLGFHPYGYTGFAYDLTPYLVYGDQGNVLAVRVDDSTQPDSRWYTGAGIYSHTWLTVTAPVHVAHWGTYVTTPGSRPEQTLIRAQGRVKNDDDAIQRCRLEMAVVDAGGAVVATVSRLHSLLPGHEEEYVRRLHMSDPHLWSVEDPYLYRLHAALYLGDELVDEYDTPFGIRSTVWAPERGFLLKVARSVQRHCLHHDAGCVGAAVPDRCWSGAWNCSGHGLQRIRCSHYPPAPELLDMADRMGFLVMDEALTSGHRTFAFGYHDYFAEWAIRDLEAMLYRDRNHPSIVLWSVGNEIPEQTRVEGVAILQQLVDVVHRLDPTRPTVSACEHINGPDAFDGPTQEDFLDTLDVVGYNYVDRWAERRKLYYSVDHHAHPERVVIGSENVSIAGIRGEYSASAEGNGYRWAPYFSRMFRGELLWKFTQTYDYVTGDYMWTGFDYLGESRWPHKGSSCGPLDTCGFPKDSYYFYQSQWTSAPMVHLFPHWNWAAARARSFR